MEGLRSEGIAPFCRSVSMSSLTHPSSMKSSASSLKGNRGSLVRYVFGWGSGVFCRETSLLELVRDEPDLESLKRLRAEAEVEELAASAREDGGAGGVGEACSGIHANHRRVGRRLTLMRGG